MPDQSELLKRQKALADFGDFVLDHEDLDAILNEACRLVAEAFGADLAKVVEIERTNDTALVRAGVGWNEGIVGKERVSLSERSSEAFSIAQGEPVITQDIGQETRFHFPDFFKDHGVVALANTPIFLPRRKPWGVLQVDAREPREFGREDIEFLKTYSMVLGPVIDRLQHVHGRQESEAKFRALFETMGQGYAECEMIRDADGRAIDYRYITINSAFERLTGIPVADAQGRTVREVVPSIEDSWIDVYEPVVREGRPVRFENLAAAFGRWYEVYAYPHGGDRFVAVYEDVTQRKQAEAALRDSEERQRLLLELSDAFREQPDEASIGATCVNTLARHLGVDRCSIAEMREDLGKALIASEFHKEGLAPMSGWHSLDDYPESLRVFRNGMPMIFTNTADDRRFSASEKQMLYGIGFGAFMSTPLYRGAGNSIFAITVGCATPREWSSGDLQLVQDVTERTWAAIERARAEAALRESEERFRRFGEASQDILWMRDAETLQWTSLTPSFETIYGLSREEAFQGDDYRRWLDLVLPEDREPAEQEIEKVT